MDSMIDGLDGVRVVMIHPLAGFHGPARSLLGLAGYLGERREILVAVPEGFVSKSIRADVPRARVLVLPGGPATASDWVRRSSSLIGSLGRERRPIVLHANGLSGLNLAAPAARRLDAPVLVHFHASRITARSRALLRLWSAAGVRMAFFADSCYSRGLLEATPARSFVRGLLPDPLDVTRFAVEGRKRHEPFRIGYVGSKSPNKGLHRLIRVAALLKDIAVEWHLYGLDLRTNRTAYVRRCLAEIDDLGLASRISWHGRVEDTRAAYAGMDVLLLPSERENIPRVSLEAMASGVPVVATRVGSVPEAVWDGIAGFLFDRHRPEEAADLLRTIARDATLWQSLSEGAVRAASRFDVSVVGRLLEDSYAQVLANGSSWP
jgi:glycosyltransferase involved in cell wall biosynthesis